MTVNITFTRNISQHYIHTEYDSQHYIHTEYNSQHYIHTEYDSQHYIHTEYDSQHYIHMEYTTMSTSLTDNHPKSSLMSVDRKTVMFTEQCYHT